MIIKKEKKESIAITSKFLLAGKVVIIPTDTVYGFSGIMGSDGEETVYKIKNRDANKKLIYLLENPYNTLKYIDMHFYKRKELEHLFSFWPAPLTIIFKAKSKDESATIAFRCPNDAWLNSLITSVGCPIFSTSANISGKTTLTNIAELQATFQNEISSSIVPLTIDGGNLKGISSTILDASKRPFSVIRQGSFLKILNDLK